MGMNWTFKNTNTSDAKNVLLRELQAAGVPSFADVSWDQDTMSVKIDKGGKSEFKLTLKTNGSDVNFIETKRDVAFLHKPFVGKVESFVDSILSRAGAAKA